MKSIIIISSLTFTVILAVVMISGGLYQDAVRDLKRTLKEAASVERDGDAEQTLYMNLARARDDIQREREHDLMRQSLYEVEDKLLSERDDKLSELIADLQEAQKQFASGSDAQASKLSKVYEAMKPAQAAPILSSLDLDIVLPILRNMKDRQAAKILAAMNPGLAAEISSRMSARKADEMKGAG